MPTLPIYEIEDELVSAFQDSSRLVLTAPTGSGKSTQVPQILLDQGLLGEGGEVVVLQPRRLAARMLARRVASERGGRLGGEVGCQVRFERQVSRETRIRYVTEGVLMRQLLNDPELRGVSAVVLDEFHERHLHGDIALAWVRELQETARPDLKLLVMSATLETEDLGNYLEPCRILRSEGRTYPVDIHYAERKRDPARTPVWDAAASAFSRAIEAGDEGHVLVFMPGGYEIGRTVEAIRRTRAARDFTVLPLHGELPSDQQDAAVGPSSRRKVVVATNVAETSLTIDGVGVVIDAGQARIPFYDPQRGIDTLPVCDISRASADQRAGRAGRTLPGTCYRLWTIHEQERRPVREAPEVKRSDLAETVLSLKAAGVPEVSAFRWFEPPDPKALERTDQLLHDLGATGPEGRITPLGRQMLSFPIHPRYARMLIEAAAHDALCQAALVAALAQGQPVLQRKVPRSVEDLRESLLGVSEASDFILHMRAWSYADHHRFRVDDCRDLGIHAGAARKVGAVYRQFLQIAERQGLPLNDVPPADEVLQRCILTGFSDHLALRRDKSSLRCAMVHRRQGELVRESSVREAPLLVPAEIREVTQAGGKSRTLLSLATAVEEEWLRELYPEDFSEKTVCYYDEQAKRILSEEQRQFRDLVLKRISSQQADPEQAACLLADEVEAGRIPLPAWDQKVEAWINRLNALAGWRPDWELPALTPEDRRFLLEQVCAGCVSRKDVKNRDVWRVLKTWLNSAQQALLDAEAPERFQLPSGRRARITYAEGAPPELSATVQDLYGLEASPTLAGGAARMRIQILAPNRRAVQVTEDMASFWKDRYPEVKEELRRRYHKHEWR